MVTAAALDARDDLDAAAVSMERLGQLTSGMWRALSHELAEAAERLDRQVDEHLDKGVADGRKRWMWHRARCLRRASPPATWPSTIEALEALLPDLEEEVRRLAASDVLLGFSVEDEVLVETNGGRGRSRSHWRRWQADAEPGADMPVPAVDVWSFLWPAPFSPARSQVTPNLAVPKGEATPDVTSVGVGVVADDVLLEALSALPGVLREDILPALSALGLACWNAHLADEHGEDDDDDDTDDDDVF